ncbi:MAG: hypothetical protein M2R45_00816 [Verrucomicrobia subdivision 3 bacterium]|nr:hypothetical protein [Limisphaerales bacterium]MCS1413078.1 hypothetical protein [Limisphaerales bacterium]
MKITSVFLAIYLLMPSLSAITVEEFSKLPDEEMLKFFNIGGIDKSQVTLDDPMEYLQCLTIGMRSASPEVREAAADRSFYVVPGVMLLNSRVLGIEGDKERAKEFYDNLSVADTDAFQRALLSLLDDEISNARVPALAALVHSTPPVPGMEDLLLTHLEREDNLEIQSEILERMAMVGYRSERFEQMVMNLLPTESGRASRVLGWMKSEVALPIFLEALSSGGSPGESTGSTFIALAGYGAKARAAIPMLEKIITEPETAGKFWVGIGNYNSVGLAKRVLKSIETDTPDPNVYSNELRWYGKIRSGEETSPAAWPLIPEIVNFSSAKVSGPAAGLPDEGSGSADVDTNDQIGSVGAALPSESTETTAPVSEESPADGGSRDAPKSGDGQRSWWRFVVTAGLLGGLLVFLLRLRQRNRTP